VRCHCFSNLKKSLKVEITCCLVNHVILQPLSQLIEVLESGYWFKSFFFFKKKNMVNYLHIYYLK
jgi:hypothetical protein